jgi:hypothetical protein
MRPMILGYSLSKEDTDGLMARGVSRLWIWQEGFQGEAFSAVIAATRKRLAAICVMSRINRRLPRNAKFVNISHLRARPCALCGK